MKLRDLAERGRDISAAYPQIFAFEHQFLLLKNGLEDSKQCIALDKERGTRPHSDRGFLDGEAEAITCKALEREFVFKSRQKPSLGSYGRSRFWWT